MNVSRPKTESDAPADKDAALVPIDQIVQAALYLRGQRVLLDADLAALYGVSTKALNQAMKRNAERFPEDFMFPLSIKEIRGNRSQSVTGSQRHRNPRIPPNAFTEHGAIMAAMILNSRRAIDMSVYVVRAFVRMRELVISDRDLERKLAALERSLVSLDVETQRQFKEVYDAIRALHTATPEKNRPIGFTAEIEGQE